MDGVSVAASIVGIATAGVQVSIKLVNLATQVTTASDRVSSIANDISLTSGVLHQLGELMKQKTKDGGTTILNQHGLETTKTSAAMCERIFQQIDKETKKASAQLRNSKPGGGRMSGEKIELSRFEKMKWPFLQPNIDTSRGELRDAKSTLMLMLQVASLALNKSILDASLSTSEHEDYVRTIVALELQRREEQKRFTVQQEGSGFSSSNDTPNSRNANTVSSGKSTLRVDDNPQPSSSRAQPGQKHPTRVIMSRKGPSDRHGRSSLDTSSSYGGERSRAPRTKTFVNLSLVHSPSSKPHQSNKPSNMPEIRPSDSSDLSPLSNSDSEIQSHPSTELQLFFLKPEVIDFSDKIELHWSMQDANMQQFAIHEHMAKNEKDGLPSVIDMLHQLHTYEQTMVDSETSKVDGGSVLSLKRTKTDIPCRDMLFKAVPGLQFVIQRQLRQARHPSLTSSFSRRRSRPVRQAPSPIESSASSRPLEDDENFEDWGSPPARLSLLPSSLGGVDYKRVSQAQPPRIPLAKSGPQVAGKSLRIMIPDPDGDLDCQEDNEAEALVTELLAKYTILSGNS